MSERRAGGLRMAARLGFCCRLRAMVEDSERGASGSGGWRQEKGEVDEGWWKGKGDREREAGKASEVKMRKVKEVE